MLEIVGLIIAIGAIGSLARGRGASPRIAGAVALVGYILIRLIAILSARNGNSVLALALLAWAWIGGVALWLRFITGSDRPKPDGMWVCKGCHYTNDSHAVLCEACNEPWKRDAGSEVAAPEGGAT